MDKTEFFNQLELEHKAIMFQHTIFTRAVYSKLIADHEKRTTKIEVVPQTKKRIVRTPEKFRNTVKDKATNIKLGGNPAKAIKTATTEKLERDYSKQLKQKSFNRFYSDQVRNDAFYVFGIDIDYTINRSDRPLFKQLSFDSKVFRDVLIDDIKDAINELKEKPYDRDAEMAFHAGFSSMPFETRVYIDYLHGRKTGVKKQLPMGYYTINSNGEIVPIDLGSNSTVNSCVSGVKETCPTCGNAMNNGVGVCDRCRLQLIANSSDKVNQKAFRKKAANALIERIKEEMHPSR